MLSLLEYINDNKFSFWSYLEHIGYDEKLWSKNTDKLTQWHNTNNINVVKQVAKDIHFRDLKFFRMYMDMNSIVNYSVKAVPLSKFESFKNKTIEVYRGGSGVYDETWPGISSYSFNRKTAESYQTFNATKASKLPVLSKNDGPTWLISGKIKVSDMLLYTNLQYENEVITDNSKIKSIKVLSQTDA